MHIYFKIKAYRLSLEWERAFPPAVISDYDHEEREFAENSSRIGVVDTYWTMITTPLLSILLR